MMRTGNCRRAKGHKCRTRGSKIFDGPSALLLDQGGSGEVNKPSSAPCHPKTNPSGTENAQEVELRREVINQRSVLVPEERGEVRERLVGVE